MKKKDLKQQEIELHKDLANKYYLVRESNKYYKFFNKYWLNHFKKIIPKGDYEKTLDLGCGTVEFYELIKEKLNSSYVGIDLSPDMLAVGRKKYKNIKLFEADAENLPFDKETFDLIIGRGVIHHLPNPLKGSKEAFRVLRKGGYFVVSEPHSNFILYHLRKLYYKISNHFSDSHKSFSENDFLNILEKSGFVIKRVEFWGILSFPFAFPDIISTYKIIPFSFFKTLVKIDNYLVNLPLIKKLSWHIIVLAQKV